MDSTAGAQQIAAALARWEPLLEDYEGLPEEQRLQLKLLRNQEYRQHVEMGVVAGNMFREMVLHEANLRARLARELEQQEREREEESLSRWLSGEEAQASLQAAIKLAAYVQETGRYGTMDEAEAVLSAEEFASYSSMIKRLREGEEARHERHVCFHARPEPRASGAAGPGADPGAAGGPGEELPGQRKRSQHDPGLSV